MNDQIPHLELFYYPTCPFCRRVLKVIDQLKVQVDLLDIHEDDLHLNRLVGTTGRQTVPCLFIDSKPMFESGDIMAWLQQNASQLKKA